MANESYNPVATPSHVFDGGETEVRSVPPARRRRAPSQTEQARREAWGAKWGPLIGNLTRIDGKGRS